MYTSPPPRIECVRISTPFMLNLKLSVHVHMNECFVSTLYMGMYRNVHVVYIDQILDLLLIFPPNSNARCFSVRSMFH